MTSRIKIVVRLLIILALGYASVYTILNTEFWLAGLWVVAFTIIAIINLILYLERSKRDLFNFLDAIRQYDFTQTSLQRYSPENKDLRKVYKEIQGIFRTLHVEKETHHLFLQTIIRHVDTAIIAYDQEGTIIEANEAVKSMFRVPYFKNLNRLLRNETELYDLLFDQKQERFTYKLTTQGNIKVLSIKATEFSIKDTPYRLVSFQDIRPELEEKELDSWQKLIRILTHEIMNSAIPISTLASVISQMMVDENNDIKKKLNTEEKSDIYGGLKTIENRSKGLSAFVDSYRTLTKVKPPNLSEVNIKVLVDQNLILLKNKLDENKVDVIVNVKPVMIMVDGELISQVIINVLLNAIDAMEGKSLKKIRITARSNESNVQLEICDNGYGIEEETFENIFIPFYSTKKEGSGIGLSLAKQIMRMHKGKISAKSDLESGTCFVLDF